MQIALKAILRHVRMPIMLSMVGLQRILVIVVSWEFYLFFLCSLSCLPHCLWHEEEEDEDENVERDMSADIKASFP